MNTSGFKVFVCIALFSACFPLQSVFAQPKPGGSEKSKIANVEKAKLGKTKNVHQCGNLYLAGQFTKEDIKTIAEKKITRVITLRTDGEVKWDQAAALKDAKMDFIKVPFRKPETLTDEVFDKIRKLLADKSKPTLFHCGSANRVGGVWLAYRVLDEGVDLKTALAEAKTVGLRTKFIEEKAIDYIKRQQKKSGKSGSKKK